MPTVTDQAICIRQWDWSETSQTVSLLTREHGVVRGLAKGSKRENSRFSGGIGLMTRGEAVAILKPSDGLATLTAWDLQEIFPAAQRSLGEFYAAMLLLDLTHHALREHDPNPQVFDSLLGALRSLGHAPQSAVVAAFALALLSHAGHRPELHIDVSSGSAIGEAPVLSFDPRAGGITESSGSPAAWRVRWETVAYLRALLAGSPLAAASSPDEPPRDVDPWAKFSGPAADRAARLLLFYFREIHQTEPAALQAYLALPISRPRDASSEET